MAWLPHHPAALTGLRKRGFRDRPAQGEGCARGSYVIVDNPNPRNGEDAAMRKTLRSTATQTVRRRLPAAAAEPIHANPLTVTGLQAELAELASLSRRPAATLPRNNWGRLAPAHLSRGLLIRVMAYRLQAGAFGDLNRKTVGLLGANDKWLSGKIYCRPIRNARFR